MMMVMAEELATYMMLHTLKLRSPRTPASTSRKQELYFERGRIKFVIHVSEKPSTDPCTSVWMSRSGGRTTAAVLGFKAKLSKKKNIWRYPEKPVIPTKKRRNPTRRYFEKPA